LTPGTKPWDLNPIHDWKMEMGLRKTSLVKSTDGGVHAESKDILWKWVLAFLSVRCNY
jgi:hypothetical protein